MSGSFGSTGSAPRVEMGRAFLARNARSPTGRLNQQVDAVFAAGESVVFDAVSHRRRMSDRLRQIARRHAASALGTPVAPPVVVFEERRRRNAIAPVRVDLPEEKYREVAALF